MNPKKHPVAVKKNAKDPCKIYKGKPRFHLMSDETFLRKIFYRHKIKDDDILMFCKKISVEKSKFLKLIKTRLDEMEYFKGKIDRFVNLFFFSNKGLPPLELITLFLVNIRWTLRRSVECHRPCTVHLYDVLKNNETMRIPDTNNEDSAEGKTTEKLEKQGSSAIENDKNSQRKRKFENVDEDSTSHKYALTEFVSEDCTLDENELFQNDIIDHNFYYDDFYDCHSPVKKFYKLSYVSQNISGTPQNNDKNKLIKTDLCKNKDHGSLPGISNGPVLYAYRSSDKRSVEDIYNDLNWDLEQYVAESQNSKIRKTNSKQNADSMNKLKICKEKNSESRTGNSEFTTNSTRNNNDQHKTLDLRICDGKEVCKTVHSKRKRDVSTCEDDTEVSNAQSQISNTDIPCFSKHEMSLVKETKTSSESKEMLKTNYNQTHANDDATNKEAEGVNDEFERNEHCSMHSDLLKYFSSIVSDHVSDPAECKFRDEFKKDIEEKLNCLNKDVLSNDTVDAQISNEQSQLINTDQQSITDFMKLLEKQSSTEFKERSECRYQQRYPNNLSNNENLGDIFYFEKQIISMKEVPDLLANLDLSNSDSKKTSLPVSQSGHKDASPSFNIDQLNSDSPLPCFNEDSCYNEDNGFYINEDTTAQNSYDHNYIGDTNQQYSTIEDLFNTSYFNDWNNVDTKTLISGFDFKAFDDFENLLTE